jgi:hypothetical protein
MTKLKHLHMTANAKLINLEQLSALKHIFSKDSLTTLYLEKFPLLEDFTVLAFSAQL